MAGASPHDLQAVFQPRSIAVIGASRRAGTIGWQILDNLLKNGFTGPVYPVNPHASVIHSVRAYPSVADVPDPVDLAVIVVPKEHVIAVAEECGRRGVKALVVITAGFKEVGGLGVERERRLMEVVRRYGMRLVGPNCMGALNTEPGVSMNATFAPTTPPPGSVAFLSQSGAMGVTILDYASEYGIGVSKFISLGNKPDVSANDVLAYWRDDAATRVVLMYLENFGNPKHFTRIARETSREKPIVVVKAARSRAGARAGSSHTGALAELDVATDALLAQCGALRADTVEELFDMAMAFANARLPRGERVAIVTNAGGPGIIIADACEALGLVVTELSEATRRTLRELLPEEAAVGNPVDMIASADAAAYRAVLNTVVPDPNVDAVIAAFVPPLGVQAEDVARVIAKVGSRGEKPVLAVLMGRQGLPQGMALLHEARVPVYIFPESAVRALAAMCRYRRWLERPPGRVAEFPADREAGACLVEATRRAGRDRLLEHEALALFAAYGIPVAPYRLVKTSEDAEAAARAIGCPVALKVVATEVVHKTDVGGVILGLRNEQELRRGFDALLDRLETRGLTLGAGVEGVLVQKMLPGGRETIIGMTTDQNFGPLLMFGLGGVYVEAIQDVAFRIQPVSDLDAAEMIRQVRGFKLLEGVRGEKGVDLGLLQEVIQRVSQLVSEHPEIREMEMNPFLAFEPGGPSAAVDARVLLRPLT
ncbi:MAG: acetate--CoA ligase family protein [Gemmatimonadetes bacterium]|nr:acetate--CoA ligase family protein [Gemmatimonadota bacterium]